MNGTVDGAMTCEGCDRASEGANVRVLPNRRTPHVGRTFAPVARRTSHFSLIIVVSPRMVGVAQG